MRYADTNRVMMDCFTTPPVLLAVVIKVVLPPVVAKHVHPPPANPTMDKATKQTVIGMVVIAGGEFLIATKLLLNCVKFIRRYHAGVHSFRQSNFFPLSGFAIRCTAVFGLSIIDSIRIPPIVAIG